MREIQLHRVYKHFKGDCYLVEDVARDAETEQEMVLYRKLYGDGSLWVRPLDEFLSEVDRAKYPNAAQCYRFELQDIPSVRAERACREKSGCGTQGRGTQGRRRAPIRSSRFNNAAAEPTLCRRANR